MAAAFIERYSRLDVLVNNAGSNFNSKIDSACLASSVELEGVSGKYFIKRYAVPSSSISNDEDVARKLWQISQDLTGVN